MADSKDLIPSRVFYNQKGTPPDVDRLIAETTARMAEEAALAPIKASVTTAKMGFGLVMSILDLGSRLVMTELKARQDPRWKPSRFDLFPNIVSDLNNYPLLKEKFFSEDAVESRWHDQQFLEPGARLLHALNVMRKDLLGYLSAIPPREQYDTAPLSVPDGALDDLGKGPLEWRNGAMVQRFRDNFNSDAGKNFFRRHPVAPDVAITSALMAVNPALMALEGGEALNVLRANNKLIKTLGEKPTYEAFKNATETWLGRYANLSNEAYRQVYRAYRAGDMNIFHAVMSKWNWKPMTLAEQFLPRIFQPAYAATTAGTRALMRDFEAFGQRIADEFERVKALSPNLRDFARKSTMEEKIAFIKTIGSNKSMNRVVTDTLAGRETGLPEAALQAVKEWNNTADAVMRQRLAFMSEKWHDLVREGRIEAFLKQSGGVSKKQLIKIYENRRTILNTAQEAAAAKKELDSAAVAAERSMASFEAMSERFNTAAAAKLEAQKLGNLKELAAVNAENAKKTTALMAGKKEDAEKFMIAARTASESAAIRFEKADADLVMAHREAESLATARENAYAAAKIAAIKTKSSFRPIGRTLERLDELIERLKTKTKTKEEEKLWSRLFTRIKQNQADYMASIENFSTARKEELALRAKAEAAAEEIAATHYPAEAAKKTSLHMDAALKAATNKLAAAEKAVLSRTDDTDRLAAEAAKAAAQYREEAVLPAATALKRSRRELEFYTKQLKERTQRYSDSFDSLQAAKDRLRTTFGQPEIKKENILGLMRQVRDLEPFMRDVRGEIPIRKWYTSFFGRGVPGELRPALIETPPDPARAKAASKMRGFLKPQKLREIEIPAEEKAAAAWIEARVGALLNQARGIGEEGRWKQLLDSSQHDLEKAFKAPAAEFGGEKEKQIAIDAYTNLIRLAKNAGAEPIRSAFVRTLDFIRTSIKTGIILNFPIGYALFVGGNQAMQAAVERGPKAFDIPPMNNILGGVNDFAKTFNFIGATKGGFNVGGKIYQSIWDVPFLSHARAAFGAFSKPFESFMINIFAQQHYLEETARLISAGEKNLQEIHKAAFSLAQEKAQDVFRYLAPQPVAIAWMERSFPGWFANHAWQQTLRAMEMIRDHPVLGSGIWNLIDQMQKHGELDEHGNIALGPFTMPIRGIGFTPFQGMQALMEMPLPDEKEKTPAAAAWRAISALAHAAPGGMPFTRMLDEIAKGDDTHAVDHSADGKTDRERRDYLLNRGSPLLPGSSFLVGLTQALTGKTPYELAALDGLMSAPDKNYVERHFNVLTNKIINGEAALGKTITKEDAQARAAAMMRNHGLGVTLGIGLQYDPGGIVRAVNRMTAEMRGLETPNERARKYDASWINRAGTKQPLLQSIAPPRFSGQAMDHKHADAIRNFDPKASLEDKAQYWQALKPSEKRYFLDNVPEYFRHMLDELKSRLAPGGTGPPKQRPPEPPGTGVPPLQLSTGTLSGMLAMPGPSNIPVMMKQAAAAAPHALDMLDTPRPARFITGGAPVNGFQWFKDELYDSKQPEDKVRQIRALDAEFNHAFTFKMNHLNLALTPANMHEALAGKVPDADGKTMLDLSPYFGTAAKPSPGDPTGLKNTRLYRAVQVAAYGSRDSLDPTTLWQKPFGVGPPGAINEAEQFISMGVMPEGKLRQLEAHERERNQDLAPWRERMRNSLSRYYGNETPNELEREIRTTPEKAGGPPKNFYARLLEAARTDPRIYGELGDFAMAIHDDPDQQAALKGFITRPKFEVQLSGYKRFTGYEINDRKFDEAVTAGHVPELQMMAMTDPNVKFALQGRGYPTARNDVAQHAIGELAVKNGFEISPRDVKSSAGLLPMVTKGFDRGTMGTLNVRTAIRGVLAGTGEAPEWEQPSVLTDKTGVPAHAESRLAAEKIQSSMTYEPKHVEPNEDFRLEIPEGTFNSAGHYLRAVVNGTINLRQRIEADKKQRAEAGMPAIPYPLPNLHSTALEYLPNLSPEHVMAGVGGIIDLTHSLGAVDYNAVRTVRHGLAQAAATGDVVNTARDLLGATSSLLSAHGSEKFTEAMARSPQEGLARMQDKTSPDYSPTLGKVVAAAGPVGEIASMLSGAINAHGENQNVSKGLGVAGGMAQGASSMAGTANPFAIALGAVAGGIFGGFTSGRGRPSQGMTDEHLSAMRERSANLRLQAQEFSARSGAAGITQNQRALTQGLRAGAPGFHDRLPQMLNYYRRPSYWTFYGNQGLVSKVESSIFKTLQPRW